MTTRTRKDVGNEVEALVHRLDKCRWAIEGGETVIKVPQSLFDEAIAALRANAHLAAADPCLLGALEDLVRRCDGPEGVREDGSNIQTLAAHTAITKATGEPR